MSRELGTAASSSSDRERGRPLGPRRRGRELAFGYLYAADVSGRPTLADFEEFIRHKGDRGPAVSFAERLIQGTLTHMKEIDDLLRELAENWTLERMAAVDRNILRLACYEIWHEEEIPENASINEAVELAKRYSTAHSGAFVNGILDRIRARLASSRRES